MDRRLLLRRRHVSPDDEPNFASFAAALRAGNPEAIVAFNPGVKVPVISHTRFEDYTAGEVNLDQMARAVEACPGRWLECDGNRAQFHILTFLGTTWCGGERPQLPDAAVIDYVRRLVPKAPWSRSTCRSSPAA